MAGCILCGCGPLRITLRYTAQPPAASHRGRIDVGALADLRPNPERIGPDLTPEHDGLSVPALVDQILREGLLAAGWEIVERSPVLLEVRLQKAWTQTSFYRVRATIVADATLREISSGAVRFTQRLEASGEGGGTDARQNHEDAYKRALTALAELAAETFGSEAFVAGVGAADETAGPAEETGPTEPAEPTVPSPTAP